MAEDFEAGRFGVQEILHFAVGVALPFPATEPIVDFDFVADVQVVDRIACVLNKIDGNVIRKPIVVLLQHDQSLAV